MPPMVTEEKSAKAADQQPLPLDWTRLGRRNRSGGDGQNDVACDCPDPSCGRVPRGIVFQGDYLSELEKEETASTKRVIQGHAIVCLHEPNPEWFQGYFYCSDNSKPWGLLAERLEIDECLQCELGGYHQMRLTVLPYGEAKKQVCDVVEWTGGDMMRLVGSTVRMTPLRLWTEQKAVPHVQRVFHKLLAKVREELGDNDESQDVLDLLPNVAVVMGTMELVVEVKPTSFDDDALWLDD